MLTERKPINVPYLAPLAEVQAIINDKINRPIPQYI